jgi:hypothetical protein
VSLIRAAQAAAVARWKADAGVDALVGDRIYDGQAPKGAVLPYVVVGEPTQGRAMESMGGAGSEVTLTCHVWSEYEGSSECLNVVTAMTAAVAVPLTLAGYGERRLREEFVTVLVDTSEEVTRRHAPVRYRIAAWPT